MERNALRNSLLAAAEDAAANPVVIYSTTRDPLMSDYPLTMTAYNRPHYLREVLEAMSRMEGIEKYHLYVSVDPSDAVTEVLGLLDGIDFCKRSWVVNEEPSGPNGNTMKAVRWGFAVSYHNFVIHFEDDILPAPDTLEYFSWGRFMYQLPGDVFAVCAFSPQKLEEDQIPYYKYATQRVPHFNPQIWGTWRDRWEEVRPQWDYNYQHQGWDWNLNRLLGDRTCLYPWISRAKHIGEFGGTHTTPETFISDSPGVFADYPANFKFFHDTTWSLDETHESSFSL